MKKLLVVFAVAGLAVALYASTAGGGQQAAVTPAQFAALKKQVATMQKQVTAAQKQVKLLTQAVVVLGTCDFNSAVPLTNAPSLHVTSPGEGTDTYAVTTTKECADAMNTPAGGLRKLLRR
jgi:hypothetical protein